MMQQSIPRTIFHDDKFHAYIANGSKGSGKSTWLEYAAEKFLKKGFLVFDLWAAPYENLFWAVPGKADPKRRNDNAARSIGYPILIVHPATVTLEENNPLCTCGRTRPEHADAACPCKRFVPLIMTVTDDTSLESIVKMVLSEKRTVKRVVVFNEVWYDDIKEAYKVLDKYMKEFPVLVKRGIIPMDVKCCMVYREVADLVTGGVKVIAGKYATETRRNMQILIRKCRHLRTQLLLDSQRNDDIAAAVSENRDYLILKQSTLDLIPEKYQDVWTEIEGERFAAADDFDFDRIDSWPSIAKLEKWQYYVIFPDGSKELRYCSQPGFMHKSEQTDWFKLLNITPKYSDRKHIPKDAEEKAQDIKNKAEKEERRKALLQKAYNFHVKDKKSYPKIAKDDLPEWSEFGKPGSLQKAVKRGIDDGDVQPI